MPKRMNFREAQAKALALRDKIPYGTSFHYKTVVIHEIGSTFHFEDAIAVDIGECWLAVFTEHYGTHTYDVEDHATFQTYEKTNKVYSEEEVEKGDIK